ncbi:MAG: hypothetical protein ACREMO_06100 [Gemmatimonadales bacterium]
MNTDQTFGIILISVLAGIGVLLSLAIPLGRAWARRLESGSRPGESDAAAEVEALTARVGELEERMDFAERLLAREREPERLPPGGR